MTTATTGKTSDATQNAACVNWLEELGYAPCLFSHADGSTAIIFGDEVHFTTTDTQGTLSTRVEQPTEHAGDEPTATSAADLVDVPTERSAGRTLASLAAAGGMAYPQSVDSDTLSHWVEVLHRACDLVEREDEADLSDVSRYVIACGLAESCALLDLRESLASVQAELLTHQVHALVSDALRSGALLPALTDWATYFGMKNIDALRGFLDTAHTATEQERV